MCGMIFGITEKYQGFEFVVQYHIFIDAWKNCILRTGCSHDHWLDFHAKLWDFWSSVHSLFSVGRPFLQEGTHFSRVYKQSI